MEALPASPTPSRPRGDLTKSLAGAEALCSKFEAHFRHDGVHDEMSPLKPGNEGVIDVLYALETSLGRAVIDDEVTEPEIGKTFEILTYFITDIRIDLGPGFSSIDSLLYFLESAIQKSSEPGLKAHASRILALKLFLRARSARAMIERLVGVDAPHHLN